MQNADNLFGYDSLAFFGRVNASISHELKNIMAIISETAGLLGDLSEMASTGTPVDPDLLKSSAESIIEEIQRGFTTIRQMNRFSHSVDVPVSSVNLLELLDLVRHLSDYLPFSGKIRLAPWEGDPPLVQTCAYQLQALVYEVTVRHFKNSGPDVELDITVEQRSDAGWDIVFSGLYIGEYQAFPDDQINQSAGSINVNLEWDRANEYLRLQLPLAIPPSVPSADDSVQDLDDGGARSL
jgi:signal transduction histidine kinase